MSSLIIIIIDKTGLAKTLNVKDYKECDLYKKCGFKQPDGFEKRIEWNNICIFGKINGKANMVNKYDFPPPLNNELFFGSCAVVCDKMNLTLDLWETIMKDVMTDVKNDEKKEVKNEPVKIKKDKKEKEKEEEDDVCSKNDEVDLSSEDIGSELSEEEYV